MTYPHRYVAAPHEEHLQCRCNPRYLVHRGNIRHVKHDDGSATAEEGGNCPAAMREHIDELLRHDASVHKAVARAIAWERSAVVAWLRAQRDDTYEPPIPWESYCYVADVVERGEHHEGKP